MKIFTGTSYFSVILIALLWIIPVTSVQAQLSQDQCLQKDHKFGIESSNITKDSYRDGMDQYQLFKIQLKAKYRGSTYWIYLLSGECSHIEGAKNSVRINKPGLDETIKDCVQRGMGPTCGVTEAEMNSIGGAPSAGNRNTQTESNNDSPPPQKLTAAERKAQQAQQKAEDLTKKQQQSAQETQAKADAARQGKRRKHDPSAEATNCIQPMEGKKEDRIKNICNFEISYTFCYYQPEQVSYAAFTTCEKQSFGADQLKPGKSHVVYKTAEKLYWHACKLPAWSLDHEYVDGKGISGRCRDVGKS